MAVFVAVDLGIDDDNFSHDAAAFVVGDAVVYGKRLQIKLELLLLGSHKPYLFLHTLRENLHGFQIVIRADSIRHPFCGQRVVVGAVAD